MWISAQDDATSIMFSKIKFVFYEVFGSRVKILFYWHKFSDIVRPYNFENITSYLHEIRKWKEKKRNEVIQKMSRWRMSTYHTTSFALVPNSLFCLFEPSMSLVASLTPRALFLVRIVFTVALKRAVLSIILEFLEAEQKPAEIAKINKALICNRAFF